MEFQIPKRESKSVEFKSRATEFRKLARTCVAFANGAGGEILIGIEDQNRAIIGITEADRNSIYDDFPNSLYDLVRPAILPQIYEKNVDDKDVLIVKIWPGSRKPYLIKSEGMPKGVYIRVGSSTRRATPEIIQDLLRENKHVSFDEENSGVERSVLSSDLLRACFGPRVSDRRLIAEKILAASHTGQDQLRPTYGGILMFCERPDEYIPEALVRCTRFAGISGRNIIQTVDLRGSIPMQIDSAHELLLSWLERD